MFLSFKDVESSFGCWLVKNSPELKWLSTCLFAPCVFRKPTYFGGFFIMRIFACMNDNILHESVSIDSLANLIKDTGSPQSNVYRCVSPYFFNSAIHNFVVGSRDFTKKTGDTCRMWVQFTTFDTVYYCWEGFYIDSTFFQGRGVKADGICSGEHITKLVLTEKARLKKGIFKKSYIR